MIVRTDWRGTEWRLSSRKYDSTINTASCFPQKKTQLGKAALDLHHLGRLEAYHRLGDGVRAPSPHSNFVSCN
jgi:hypothetical protein